MKVDESTILPWTDMTLASARTRLAALHFSKEMLTAGERGILYTAEALLRLIDANKDK